MIYLDLFLTFFKIGLFSFGGGAGMIALLREEVFSHGWLSEEMLSNFIGVSESTPGPIAVNMATFVGSSQGGAAGAVLATLGVITPAFIVIILIAALLKNFLKYKAVGAALAGMRPVVLGLILSVGIMLAVQSVLPGYKDFSSTQRVDVQALLALGLLTLFYLGYSFLKNKAPSPILLILFSVPVGIILF